MSSYTTTSPRYLEHAIGVAFRDGISREDRQATVDAVGGEVIDGWRQGPHAEGIYLLRVDDGDNPERLREMRLKLRAMPQVKAERHA